MAVKKLTKADIKKAAKKAYKKGLLVAQSPNKEDANCRYAHKCSDGVTRFCAIGAAIPKKIALEYADAGAVYCASKISTLINRRTLDWAATFQQAHDKWCNSIRNKHNDIDISIYKMNFLEMMK